MTFAAAQEFEAATAVAIRSVLPVLAVLIPFTGALAVYLCGLFFIKIRNLLAVATAAGTFAAVLAMYPLVHKGEAVYRVADVMSFGIYFRADFMCFFFSLIFAGSWLVATVYATVYMQGEQALNRFYFFLLFTLGSSLGVVLAGDLISLFLFFELMTFSSYVLVIHRQGREAIRAGAFVIFMGITGGLFLLMGIFILFWGVGSMAIVPMLDRVLAAGIDPLVVIPLFMVGFGIKMGIVPLHIWLPKAYMVSPTPVNVISSAAMIKAGAYGMIRIINMIFTSPDPYFAGAEMLVMKNIGFAVIWLGIVTMLVGAFLAVLQKDTGRILGCSSVSQMGYILMSIGAAAYLGYEKGAVGFTGALYHIFNHSLLKATLFFVVGAIYLMLKDTNTARVGGLMKKVPFTAAAFLIAYAGISGVPGGSGYASKAIMHRAIVYAYSYGGGNPSLLIAEKLYVLANVLTIIYLTKLFAGLFLGPLDKEQAGLRFKVSPLIKGILAICAAAVLTIGLFPNLVLNRLVIPAAAGFCFSSTTFTGLREINFFLWYDLKEPLTVFVLAAILFFVMHHCRAFSWIPPRWLSVEYLFYRPVAHFIIVTCCNFSNRFDAAINSAYLETGRVTAKVCNLVTMFDSTINDACEKTGETARRLAQKTEQFDATLCRAGENPGNPAGNLLPETAELAEGKEEGREHASRRSGRLWDWLRGRPADWNIKNLNFDSMLLALMLGFFLYVLIYYARR